MYPFVHTLKAKNFTEWIREFQRGHTVVLLSMVTGLLLLFGSCICERQWTLADDSSRCSLKSIPGLASAWKERLQGKEGAKGCLRLNGQGSANASGQLVLVKESGELYAYEADGKTLSTQIRFAQQDASFQSNQFTVFLFGKDVATQEQAALCKRMAEPSYVCLEKKVGECWFSLKFSPEGTQETSPQKKLSCKLFSRKSIPTESSSEESIIREQSLDAGISEAGKTELVVPEFTGAESKEALPEEKPPEKPVSTGPPCFARELQASEKLHVRDLVVEKSGRVRLVGSFEGRYPHSQTTPGRPIVSKGEEDFFTANFDKTGKIEKFIGVGGKGSDFGAGIALDKSGNTYLVGSFQRTVKFVTTEYTAYGGQDIKGEKPDIFLSKLDAQGNFLWTKRIGTAKDDFGLVVKVAPSGNIYVGGVFRGVLSLGGKTRAPKGNGDAFIAKFDRNGAMIWFSHIVGEREDYIRSFTLDEKENVYVYGQFDLFLYLNGSPATRKIGSEDIFVMKIEPLKGNQVWFQTFGGALQEGAGGIVVSKSGKLYISGTLRGEVSFGSEKFKASGGSNAFVACLDATNKGALVWAKMFEGNSNELGRAIALDSAENVYVLGDHQDSIYIKNSQAYCEPKGQSSVFIYKLTKDGGPVWCRNAVSDGGTSHGTTLVVQDNRVTFAGFFSERLKMGANRRPLQAPSGKNAGFIGRLDTGGSWNCR